MNANMKRLLIFALVPVTVWAIGSTFTKQKIDRIGVNTESQITMEDTTRFSSGTALTVPYLDANKDFVSSSVTPTELGYLSGVTSSIQTQIDSKQTSVSGTANEIDVAADIVGLADNPILPGLESVTIPAGADGDRPSSPVNGMIRYNTTSSSFEGYQAGAWGELGGGSGVGGSRLQLISDPSFEEGVTEGSCTGCTATQDTTDKLGTDNNLASLKMAFSASSGDYTLTKSTSAQYSNVAGTVSAWIKTSASDCHFDELVDGTQSQTVAIGSSDEWKQYIINGTTGTTSYGWRVRCDTAITDDVFVDETFAGAAEPDVFDIGTASHWGTIRWKGTDLGDNDCDFSTTVGTANTWTSFASDADCDDVAATSYGSYVSSDTSAGSTDIQKPQIKFSYIPAGVLSCRVSGYQNTNRGETKNRFFDGTSGSAMSNLYVNPATDVGSGGFEAEFKYDTPQTSETTIELQTANITGGATAHKWFVRNQYIEELEISCYHYPAPQKVVAAKCDGLECVNEFNANVSSTGVVTNENVDWINGSVAVTDTSLFTYTLTSGLFNVAPICNVDVVTSGTSVREGASIVSSSTTTVVVRTGYGGNSAFTKNANDHVITCHRAGSDYKQFQQRFIPVVDPEARFAKATSSNFTGTAQTKLDLIDNDDNYNMINETLDRYEIDKTGLYEIKIKGSSSAGTSNWFGLWYSVNGGSITLLEGIAPTASSGVTQSGSVNIRLNSGDYVEIYANSGSTTAVTSITSSVKLFSENLNAFIGNLTPKEFVQTPGSTKPVMYSATVSSTGVVSLEVGNFISGDCTNPSTGRYTCTFESSIFSQTPNCVAMVNDVDGRETTVKNASVSSVSVNATDGGAQENNKFTIICHGVQ